MPRLTRARGLPNRISNQCFTTVSRVRNLPEFPSCSAWGAKSASLGILLPYSQDLSRSFRIKHFQKSLPPRNTVCFTWGANGFIGLQANSPPKNQPIRTIVGTFVGITLHNPAHSCSNSSS